MVVGGAWRAADTVHRTGVRRRGVRMLVPPFSVVLFVCVWVSSLETCLPPSVAAASSAV